MIRNNTFNIRKLFGFKYGVIIGYIYLALFLFVSYCSSLSYNAQFFFGLFLLPIIFFVKAIVLFPYLILFPLDLAMPHEKDEEKEENHIFCIILDALFVLNILVFCLFMIESFAFYNAIIQGKFLTFVFCFIVTLLYIKNQQFDKKNTLSYFIIMAILIILLNVNAFLPYKWCDDYRYLDKSRLYPHVQKLEDGNILITNEYECKPDNVMFYNPTKRIFIENYPNKYEVSTDSKNKTLKAKKEGLIYQNELELKNSNILIWGKENNFLSKLPRYFFFFEFLKLLESEKVVYLYETDKNKYTKLPSAMLPSVPSAAVELDNGDILFVGCGKHSKDIMRLKRK